MRKLALLLIFSTLAIAQTDARTRAYIHAMIEDSAAVMRETIHDTADVVRGNTKTYANDTANVLRGEMPDSTLRVLNDSAAVFRAEMTDSAEDVWNDSIPIARAEMTDSANDVWNDSIAVARGEFYDSAVVAVTDSAIIKSGLKANWVAGDYDITGLEKVEADTIEATVVLESPYWLCGTGGTPGTGQIVATKVQVPGIENITTTCLIDSFKLNAAEDTLFFYIGGKGYVAPEEP